MNRLQIIGMILTGYIKSFKKNKTEENNSPIDFVVTWVNGNDPNWQKERREYFGDKEYNKNGNGTCRYRDWSSFRYWFRAVEKYAPWVHNVYLVTWGHIPDWLNKECPKLKVVKHTDYIPTEFLPTYNSIPIELNLFRILDLSERFVYFNDDMFLSRPVSEYDFFENGKPKHSAIAYPLINRDNEIPTNILFNTYGALNKKNNICESIRKYPDKWFSHAYKSAIKYNINAFLENGLPGLYFTHMGIPLCKSTMESTWMKYEKECSYSSNCRLRDINQIMHQIFSGEDMINGNFEPSACDWGTCIKIDDIDMIDTAYRNGTKKMICLFDNDSMDEKEIEETNKKLIDVFEKHFPEKSMFEI